MLLDLDSGSLSELRANSLVSSNTNLQSLQASWEELDSLPTDRLEEYAHASLILWNKLTNYIESDFNIRAFMVAFRFAVTEKTKDYLRYPLNSYYPVVCGSCFMYYGHILGGALLPACDYCTQEEGRGNRTRYFQLLGQSAHYFPHSVYNREGRILLAQMVYKYFAKGYYG